jgi:hypothetical protein
MSTRSLTVVLDEEGDDVMVLYRHWDGYPDAHGQELKKFLFGRKIVNGIGANDKNNFNGMECLAASLVAHFISKKVLVISICTLLIQEIWVRSIFTISKIRMENHI